MLLKLWNFNSLPHFDCANWMIMLNCVLRTRLNLSKYLVSELVWSAPSTVKNVIGCFQAQPYQYKFLSSTVTKFCFKKPDPDLLYSIHLYLSNYDPAVLCSKKDAVQIKLQIKAIFNQSKWGVGGGGWGERQHFQGVILATSLY